MIRGPSVVDRNIIGAVACTCGRHYFGWRRGEWFGVSAFNPNKLVRLWTPNVPTDCRRTFRSKRTR